MLTKIGGLGRLWDGNWLLVLFALLCHQWGIFLHEKLIHCPVNEWGTSLNRECWGTACPKVSKLMITTFRMKNIGGIQWYTFENTEGIHLLSWLNSYELCCLPGDRTWEAKKKVMTPMWLWLPWVIGYKDAARSDLKQVSGYIALGAKVKSQLEFPSVPLAIDNGPDRYR